MTLWQSQDTRGTSGDTRVMWGTHTWHIMGRCIFLVMMLSCFLSIFWFYTLAHNVWRLSVTFEAEGQIRFEVVHVWKMFDIYLFSFPSCHNCTCHFLLYILMLLSYCVWYAFMVPLYVFGNVVYSADRCIANTEIIIRNASLEAEEQVKFQVVHVWDMFGIYLWSSLSFNDFWHISYTRVEELSICFNSFEILYSMNMVTNGATGNTLFKVNDRFRSQVVHTWNMFGTSIW